MADMVGMVNEMMAEIVTLKTLLCAAGFRTEGIGDCTEAFDRKLHRNITMALMGGHRNVELCLSEEQQEVRKLFAAAPLHKLVGRL